MFGSRGLSPSEELEVALILSNATAAEDNARREEAAAARAAQLAADQALALALDEALARQLAGLNTGRPQQSPPPSQAPQPPPPPPPAARNRPLPAVDDEFAQISKEVNVPGNAVGALIGSGGRTLRKLQRDLGVTIRVTSQGPGQPATFTVTGMRHPVMVASEELQRNSANVDDLLSRMGQHFEQEVHCFVDYSNIYIAAQSSRQPGNRQSAFLNAKALKDRVVDERTARKLVVVGSLGSEEQAERCRQEWTSAGFQHVHFVARPAGMGEADLAIDDKIVSEALLSVARDYPKPQKLVILTGDGNDNHGWASFRDLVETAMRKGWGVELWSWSSSVARVYRNFAQQYPGSFHLYQLDMYRREIMSGGNPGSSSADAHHRRSYNNINDGGRGGRTGGRGRSDGGRGRDGGGRGRSDGRGRGRHDGGRGGRGRGRNGGDMGSMGSSGSGGRGIPQWNNATSPAPPAAAAAAAPDAADGGAPECPICLDKPADHTWHCGHRLCGDCGKLPNGQPRLQVCHVCRQTVTGIIRLYP